MKRKLFLLSMSLVSAFSLTAALLLSVSAQQPINTDRQLETPAGGAPSVRVSISGTGHTIVISGQQQIIIDSLVILPAVTPTPTPTITRLAPVQLTLCTAPNQELCNVDRAFAGFWSDIQKRQELFYRQYGEYWQGLIIGPGKPIARGYQPTDKSLDWHTFFGGTFTRTLPYTITVDVYSGPVGDGYMARISYGVYEKIYSVGRDNLAHEWRRP